MVEIVNAELNRIVPNPFRMLEKYPYSEEKLATLQSSIEETGFWEGVIARRHGDEFQLAFGHHRVQAARLAGLCTVPLIIRALTDEQMLQLMGRENMEDYGTSFLVSLETWEAASKYFTHLSVYDVKKIEVAKLLGWVRKQTALKGEDNFQIDNTAKATSGALELINKGYHKREDFVGLSTTAVMQLVTKGNALINQAEKIAKAEKLSEEQLEKQKERIVGAVNKTAEMVREEKLATNDISEKVDTNRRLLRKEEYVKEPMFKSFGKRLFNSIEKMLKQDTAAKNIEEIRKSLGLLEFEEDKKIVELIDIALSELMERADKLKKQLTIREAKVVGVKASTQKALGKPYEG
jgi:ParB family chromosome partitioning protein